jgi:uncharacterized protein
MSRFSPAWWLPGPHSQTLWGKLFRQQELQPTEIERWDTADGDFLDIHHLNTHGASTRLLVLHGLEGTIRSHYAQGLLSEARKRGWAADMLIFRSCGKDINLTRRFYHSGDTSDLEMVIGRILADFPDQILVLAGVSLGGNVLLKFLGERGSSLSPRIRAAAAVSVPFDLSRASRFINRGASKIYQWHFMKSLRRKVLLKLERFPELIERQELMALRTMFEFDNELTAPVHGFRDAEDYYTQSSSLPWLSRISIPTLLLNAADDPFLPAEVLDDVRHTARENPSLIVEFPARGGHAGFIGGHNPFRPVYYMERRVCDFLAEQITQTIALAG